MEANSLYMNKTFSDSALWIHSSWVKGRKTKQNKTQKNLDTMHKKTHLKTKHRGTKSTVRTHSMQSMYTWELWEMWILKQREMCSTSPESFCLLSFPYTQEGRTGTHDAIHPLPLWVSQCYSIIVLIPLLFLFPYCLIRVGRKLPTIPALF